MTLQNSQIRISSSNDIEQLERKIDSLTKSLSKPYFNKILKGLSKRSLENANIICDYIVAEQTEINIKDSTKEGKIKILVWLSNHFQDKESYRNMTRIFSSKYCSISSSLLLVPLDPAMLGFFCH